MTISEPLAETIRRTFGVRTHVVMNGIDRRPAPAAPAGVEAPSGTLTLAHTGYIYPGKRDPGPLLDAIALLGRTPRRCM
ncbi:hypothetical protein V2I01_27765 [Micromonospora sp. BRA006-A]|nr:hypothetical protein [Micromonospora sp. BRA006-A]